jgi:hypothetical protein
MLQHHRDLFGIAGAQIVRHLDAGMGGAEGDVEMMRAGQPVLTHVAQHAARHAAQGVVDILIVPETFVGHGAACTSIAP